MIARKTRFHWALSLLATLVLVAPGLGSTPTFSQKDGRLFPETGKTVRGDFLAYWEAHGALPQQGYPISDEMLERSGTDGKVYKVQYFERAVFELHPENARPYNVLLSLLGNFAYKSKYMNDAPNQAASTDKATMYPQTGKSQGGVFREYWEKNGGLAQQGYPISDEFQEKSDLNGKTYKVQYFERAVFEFHPENSAPFNVLLSQLGTFQYKEKAPPTSEEIARLITVNGRIDADVRDRSMLAKAQTQGKTVRRMVATSLSPGTGTGTTPTPTPCSQVETVGDAPQGFASDFYWCREDQHAFLVAFINAANSNGLAIAGLQPGDIITATEASGIAYFADDKANPLASDLVGLIAAGAGAGSTLADYPGAIPVIDAAEKVAQDQFRGTGEPTKPRDAYGVEPSSGDHATQEGGILVSLPEAGGAYYSGGSDHMERRIKQPGTRIDANLPDWFLGRAYFPIQGDDAHNTRVIGQAGTAFIVPWDWDFGDNSGYYKVFIYISKGTPPAPTPEP